MKWIKKRQKARRVSGLQHHGHWGQGLVEFALILPILLLIICVVIEAAFIIQGYLAVQHAAREAVRWAIGFQPVQGEQVNQDMCTAPGADPPFLFTDAGYICDPDEDNDEHNARRVALIKEKALQSAAGLRVDANALGLTASEFNNNFDEPGFLGVRVWGFPSFEDSEQLDHHSLPGLPVRVQVVHNVEIVDPFFRIIATHVQVRSHAEMINEGIQVGYGNVAPPTFNPPATFVPPPTSTPGGPPTETPVGGPSPTAGPILTPTPESYQIDISFDYTENILPFQRGRNVTVTVFSGSGYPLSNVAVSFSTDKGSYDYSGVGSQYAQSPTNGSGVAIRTVYANDPGIAALRAWIDLNGNDQWDGGEPYDTAVSEWVTIDDGPYILVSPSQVLPLDTISVDIYDHDPVQNPYTLLWCRTSITGGITSTVLAETIDVDAGTWDATDLAIETPAGSSGDYRLETHTSIASCGNAGTLVAYSADIRVLQSLPDLIISSLNPPGVICPSTIFTMSVVIENLSSASTAELFDVDLYVDPEGEPLPGRMGIVKQWVTGIDPYGTVELNVVMWIEGDGEHEIWARVDTSDYIAEENEENNVRMVTVTTGGTSWRSPTANAATSGGDGNGFERDPENAYGNGGGYAESRDNGRSGSTTDRHIFHNYGLDIPQGATITGMRCDWTGG